VTQLQVHESSSAVRGVMATSVPANGSAWPVPGRDPRRLNHAPLSFLYKIMPSGIPQRMTH
jgi:hypothetical protein